MASTVVHIRRILTILLVVAASERLLATEQHYHSQPREMLPQHTINATVRAIETQQGERWMFLDISEDGPAQTRESCLGTFSRPATTNRVYHRTCRSSGSDGHTPCVFSVRTARCGISRSQCLTGRVQSSDLRWSDPRARCSQLQRPVSG
jgi:hypothetical protein